MGETVEFPSNGHTCSGYLAIPSGGRGPGVVVIQEWWGLVPHIRDVCERFAADGFVALAPDLYHGRETAEPDEAGKLLMEMDVARASRDMLGAATWLAASDRTAGDRVGVVGFCVGGALAIHAATSSDVFAAAVAFYPGLAFLERTGTDLSQIHGAVMGHFAGLDHSYKPDQVERLALRLREAGADVEVHWYPEADHAFFNDSRPQVHRQADAKLAWDRTVAFFRKHLAATPAPV